MRFIIRDTDYAMQALVFMAHASRKGKDVVTVDEIVDELNLPERFMRKILQRLAKKEILSSYKGKDGGFSFAKPPGQICLTDIIEIFQGKVDITNCLLKGRICPNVKRCALRKRLKGVGLSVNRELRNIIVESLL